MEPTPAQLPAAQPAAAKPSTQAAEPGSLQRLLDSLRRLGAGRLAALGLAAVALLGLFAHLVLRVAETEYGLLYAGLEVEDSAEIVQRLDGLNVPYRLRDDGASILVPSDQALRLRLSLAEEGLPRGGSVGYEIFDQTSAFGTTSFLADVNLRRALEGELARTITALADVRAARVHLVLPRRQLFQRDRVEPSAAVTLRMAGGRRLTRRQVLAIRHLVAAAAPGLDPERITVVDDQGTLLARGGDGVDGGIMPSQAEEHRAAFEARLKQTIEQLLEPTLGPGRVRAEVHAEIDFDQVTTTEESFDPEGQVVRSTQTVEEETRRAERDQNDAVTVGNNLPNAAAEGGDAARTSNEDTTREEETVNYEISRTVRNHTQVGGRVRRLSVAVLVTGRMVPDESGTPVYQPLEADRLEQIESLVRSAVGFDESRGDVVDVRSMPFDATAVAEVETSWLTLSTDDLLRVLELLVLAAVALLLVLLVVRPALRQLTRPALAGALADHHAPALTGRSALAAGEGGAAFEGAGEGASARERLAGPSAPDKPRRVEVDSVSGPIRADLVQDVVNAIDESPDDVASIIRSWIHEK